jgi:antitoxin ParD1/3/4
MNITELKTALTELSQNELAEFLEWLEEFKETLAYRQWIDGVRVKIDAAVAMSEHTPPIDGETFIAGICDRFRQIRETQHRNADCPERQLPGAIDAI